MGTARIPNRNEPASADYPPVIPPVMLKTRRTPTERTMKTALVLSSRDCKYCSLVFRLLDDAGYQVTTYDHLPTIKAGGFKTVPQVFINGDHIGGYEDTKRFLETYVG